MRDAEHRLASAWALAAHRATLSLLVVLAEEILARVVLGDQAADAEGSSRGLVLMELPSLVMCEHLLLRAYGDCLGYFSIAVTPGPRQPVVFIWNL